MRGCGLQKMTTLKDHSDDTMLWTVSVHSLRKALLFPDITVAAFDMEEDSSCSISSSNRKH